MFEGKYIIIDFDGSGFRGTPILFHSIISHDTFLNIYEKDRIMSAGFFMVGAEPTEKDDKDIGVSVWGKSVTLGKKTREEDAELIKNLLRPE